MRAIIYANNSNGTVILEYWFKSKFEQRKAVLSACEDFQILWTTDTPCSGNWLKAFWRCLIGYSDSRKINE